MAVSRRLLMASLGAASLPGASTAAIAGVDQVRIAQQYGLTYLPFIVAQHERLIEKYAKENGIPRLRVVWSEFAGPSDINNALLSGNIDVAPTAIPSFLVIWARSKGSLNIKALAGYGRVPFTLVTNDPQVHSLKDFSDKDRIAVTAVGTSLLGIMLQMQAEQKLGDLHKLDSLMIARSHPDAMVQVISGKTELNSHFSIPPYATEELAASNVHAVMTSDDLKGGPFSNGVIYMTQAFHDANPKISASILRAVDEACKLIHTDPKRVARMYLDVSHEKSTPDSIVATLTTPGVVYDTVPHGLLQVADFMYRTGTLIKKPSGYDDLLFQESPRPR